MGTAYFALGDLEAAIDSFSKANRIIRSRSWGHVVAWIAALALLGRDEEAREIRDETLSRYPELTLDEARSSMGYLGDALIDGLRKAGLPEG